MVNVIVKVDSKEVEQFIKTLPKKLRSGMEKTFQRYGKNLEKNFKMASAEAGFWSGETYQSIQWRKRKLGGHLEIGEGGIELDKSTPHWVKLSKGRKVTEWAIAHNIAIERKYGGADSIGSPFPTKSLYVFKHNKRGRGWIERTQNQEIPKLDQFIKRELDKVIK